MAGYVRFRDGAWRIRVEAGVDPVTRRRRQVHATVHAPDNKLGRKAANDRRAELEVEVATGRVVASAGITVAELVDLYISDRAPHWSPGSADATRRRVAQHITPHIGAVRADKLRPVDIRALHRRWTADKLSASTAGRMHDIIRAAFRQAVRDEAISRDPTAPIARPTGEVAEIAPPDAKVLARIMDKADATLTLYLRLAALTGARRGQMCALRWTAIDLPGGQIRFTRALAKVVGGTVEKDTKTGARYTVAIDPATVKLLKAHRIRQAAAALAAGAPLADDAYLFARDPAATLPWHPDGATQRFARTCAAAKVTGVRLHDLRHWMATTVLTEGFDIVTVAGRGGWSDANTPLEVYSHFQPATDRRAANRLAKILDA